MSEPDYIAVCDEDGTLKWFDRSTFKQGNPPPLPSGSVETIFAATGELVEREDGEVAETWKPLLI